MTSQVVARADIIAEYGQNPQDTGSSASQVALLTARIRHLTEHAKAHHHDHAGRRGLVGLVNRRRKLLKYLKRKDLNAYRDLIQRLQLRDSY